MRDRSDIPPPHRRLEAAWPDQREPGAIDRCRFAPTLDAHVYTRVCRMRPTRADARTHTRSCDLRGNHSVRFCCATGLCAGVTGLG